MSLVIHGSTKSKELLLFGIGLFYTDVLDLEAAWAVSEVSKVFY